MPEGIRANFDTEEMRQVGALAIVKANRDYPGHKLHAYLRAKEARARHNRKQARYYERRDGLNSQPAEGEAATGPTLGVVIHCTKKQKRESEVQMSRIMVREMLELLPLTVKDEVLTRLLDGTWPEILKAAKLVREHIPDAGPRFNV